jgi:glycosyltransferase involved in cell wall biosynthesis
MDSWINAPGYLHKHFPFAKPVSAEILRNNSQINVAIFPYPIPRSRTVKQYLFYPHTTAGDSAMKSIDYIPDFFLIHNFIYISKCQDIKKIISPQPLCALCGKSSFICLHPKNLLWIHNQQNNQTDANDKIHRIKMNPRETPQNHGTDLPSVSVVTVVYNNAAHIEKTIQSIINQQYPRLEYIIIDGGSTDGTVDTIKKYAPRIDHLVSEKDRGVYDAMNKGIDLASGDYINFMNAGDLFYQSTTILDVFQSSPADIDFIYGDVIMRGTDGDKYIGTHRPLDEIWKAMPFCHQTLFSKTSLLKQNRFPIHNKISSDYASIFLHYINGKTFFNCKEPVAIIAAPGISSDFPARIFERWRFVRKYFNYKVDLYYLALLVYYLIKNYLPPKMSNFIINKVYTLKFVTRASRKTTNSLLQ